MASLLRQLYILTPKSILVNRVFEKNKAVQSCTAK